MIKAAQAAEMLGMSTRFVKLRVSDPEPQESPLAVTFRKLAARSDTEMMSFSLVGRGRLELPTNGLKAPWGTECGGAV